MATKALWFQPVLDELDDPFALPIERVGVPIVLSGRVAALGAEVVELVNEVARLAATGVACPILRMADTSCHACPISEHGRATPKGELCTVGRTLEMACTRLAVLEDGR
jgi:hypothetical protein